MSTLFKALCTLFIIAILAFLPELGAAQTPSRLGRLVDERSLVSLSGNVHPLARTEFNKGLVADDQSLSRMLFLLQRSPEQELALEELLREQQDKSSKNYHAWITPQEFGEQFGPTDEDVQTVIQWLAAHGFTNIKVANGRTAIEFSGNVAMVRNAFHTEIHRYLVEGEDHIANASDPQIPIALRPLVAGIVSLHNFRKKPKHHLVDLTNNYRLGWATHAPQYTFNCVDFFTSIFGSFAGQSPSCHPLGPYDFATIYNVLPLWNATSPIDGSGQSIAIVARTNIDVQDVADFRSLFGLSVNPPQIILDGADPGFIPGDKTEATLDVEWSGAVAKGATIKLVVSESTETTDGIDLSALYVVDHNLAPVMSTSYGQCELYLGTAGNQFYHDLWQQAAAQGISVFVSSGDNGSAGCDPDQGPGPQPAQHGQQVNGLASTPFNVAVGGTDFNDYFNQPTYWNATNNTTTLESAKGYIPETTWNQSCTNAVLENPVFHLSSNAETNCNNADITTWFAFPLAGSGGKSSCTTPAGTAVSNCSGGYAKPSWQVGSGVPNDGKRDLPDVSLFASGGFEGSFYMMCEVDPTNPQPCSTGYFLGVGGTSVSSPAFAGLLALVNQKTGSRQGNANPVFYSLAAKQAASTCNSSTGPASTCIFNDVTSGTIAMPCATGTANCATANSADQIGILAGFQAGSGYDLATGLGSVNAANLVNNWNSVSGKTSATSLTLNGGNSVSITHGTPVNVAVSVSPTSPQPSGLASLIAIQGSESLGIGTFAVNNGGATGTTNMLPGGSSYSVFAHYAGDSNYVSSDSNSVAVTVSPEQSATQVHVAVLDLATGGVSNPDATSIPYGSIYVLRGEVTNSSGTTCFNSASATMSYGCPTGTLSFALDGTALGAAASTLNSEGYAENQSVQLNVGPHSFAGSYSGDNSYLASSGKDAITVTAAPTIASTQTLFPLPIGTPIGFMVHARSKDYGVFPSQMSGTFAIFDGSTQVPISEYTLPGVIYPAPNSPYVWETLDGEITATFSGTPGTHSLTVNYSGDANYAASTSGSLIANFVYPTQTTLTPSAPSIVDGQSLTVTAQIVPAQNANSPPSGNIVFSLDSSPYKTVAVTNNQAQLTIPGLVTSTVLVGASYSGDSNYGNSSASLLEPVLAVTTSTSITSSSATVNQGASVTFTATVTPAQMGAAPMTGPVQFAANGAPIGSKSVSNNQAQITTSLSTLGSVQIEAAYGGDTNYSASSGSLTMTVVLAPDFSIASTGAVSQTVTAGQTATFANAITVSALNGFSSQVNLTCSLPATAKSTTCLVNPNMFGAGSGTASVVITTTSRSVSVPPTPPDIRFYLRPQWIWMLLFLIFLAALFASRRKQGRLGGFSLPTVCSLALCVWIGLHALGCGGGSSIQQPPPPPPPPPPAGTPAGTYVITVNGVSASTSHTTTLTLIVQ